MSRSRRQGLEIVIPTILLIFRPTPFCQNHIVDKKALLKGFEEHLKQRGVVRRKPCHSEADRFFRWLYSKHVSLYKATPGVVHGLQTHL